VIATFNLSGTINVGQAMIASANCATNFTPDFILPNGQDWRGGDIGFFNGQSQDGAMLYNENGILMDAAVINDMDNNDWFMDGVAIRKPTICEGFTSGNKLCNTLATCNDLSENWNILLSDGNATPQEHFIEDSICPEFITSYDISNASNQFDESFCNQTVYIKGVLNPMIITDNCGLVDNITPTFSIDIIVNLFKRIAYL